MAFFGAISSSSGLLDRESESLSGSLQACSSSFFDWWKFYFRLVGWVAWEAETLKLLWSLDVEVETLQPCMKTCKIHQQFVLVWWKTFNGEHSDLNNSMDASTDYLNIASTFLAASMKFHQSNIIFNYSPCYAWWPWKPESRYIHIKYFAYRGAVHFQEVSSRMSRRGESETGNWLPTWKWFADYLDPLNPPIIRNTQIHWIWNGLSWFRRKVVVWWHSWMFLTRWWSREDERACPTSNLWNLENSTFLEISWFGKCEGY